MTPCISLPSEVKTLANQNQVKPPIPGRGLTTEGQSNGLAVELRFG